MWGVLTMPADKVRKRDPSLDIIRICAFLFVVSVHFFPNCGFYDTTVAGEGMLLAIFPRSFFMICVPLFMVLTGYLTGEKTVCWAYYRKLVDTIGVYVLAALCCKGYQILRGEEDYWIYRVVSDVLNYSAAPYGWYVEMYIGLFLLCPFLNVAYKALGEKRKKQSLLAVLLLDDRSAAGGECLSALAFLVSKSKLLTGLFPDSSGLLDEPVSVLVLLHWQLYSGIWHFPVTVQGAAAQPCDRAVSGLVQHMAQLRCYISTGSLAGPQFLVCGCTDGPVLCNDPESGLFPTFSRCVPLPFQDFRSVFWRITGILHFR